MPDGTLVMGIVVNGQERWVTGKDPDDLERVFSEGILRLVYQGVWPIRPLVGKDLVTAARRSGLIP